MVTGISEQAKLDLLASMLATREHFDAKLHGIDRRIRTVEDRFGVEPDFGSLKIQLAAMQTKLDQVEPEMAQKEVNEGVASGLVEISRLAAGILRTRGDELIPFDAPNAGL